MVPVRRNQRLDGLRALAILAVVLFHFGDAYPDDDAVGRLVAGALSAGWVGVEMFFALSGFLVTRRLLEEDDVGAFLARRAVRILPPYLGLLVVWFLILPVVVGWAGIDGVSSVIDRVAFPWVLDLGEDRQAWYWLMGASWARLAGTRVPMLSHLWFVSVEVQLYLLWPLATLLLKGRRLGVLCIALAVAAVAVRIALLGTGVAPDIVYELPPARLEGFALGALVAVAARDRAWFDIVRRTWAPAAGLGLAGAAATFLLAGGPDLYARPVQLLGYTSLALVAAAAVAGALLAPPGRWWAVWLEARSLRQVARHSYAAYLVHFPLCFAATAVVASRRAHWLASQPGYLVFMAAGLACTGLLAVGVWWLLERWTQRLAAWFWSARAGVGPSP